MRGSALTLPRPAIYAITNPKGLRGEYQFAGAAADSGFSSAFAVDRSGDAAQLLSLGVRTLYPILCMMLLFCGCSSQSKLDSGNFDDFLGRASHSKKQSGDFGAFFVQQVAHFGGHTISSGSPPVLSGTWYFESDKDGFGAQLYDTTFVQVRSFMEETYGPPRFVETNLYGSWCGLYGAREIGVAIQF